MAEVLPTAKHLGYHSAVSLVPLIQLIMLYLLFMWGIPAEI